MWSKGNSLKNSKLSRELLYIFLLDFGISTFAFFFLRTIAKGILISYLDNNNIILEEMQEITYFTWITAISFIFSTLLFSVLFLILIGQKLSYLKDIIEGIDNLTAHRLNYKIPVRDSNEFTQLAEAINVMAETELELKKKEEELSKEKQSFIRNMSHDIRTPLTSIISHTEFMKSKLEPNKDQLSEHEELSQYLDMTLRKSLQIKELTNRLLESENTPKEQISDGRLFLVQLAEEWLDSLEGEFDCMVDVAKDISFSRELDVQEFLRIFDNLASNIEKYADEQREVSLKIYKNNNRLVIEQSNYKSKAYKATESYKIGLGSISQIAQKFGGHIEVKDEDEYFNIKITLFSI